MKSKLGKRVFGLGSLLLLSNGMLWIGGAWSISRIYFSAIVFVCAWPLLRLIGDPDSDLPGFAVISLIYGGYFGLMGLIPFTPYITMASVSEHDLERAGLYGLMGVLALQIGYRLALIEWSNKAMRLHPGTSFQVPRIGLLGVVGSIGWVWTFAANLPVALRSLSTLCSELLTLAFIILLERQLQGVLSRRWLLVNWGCFAPVILITALGVSKIYPLVRLVLIVMMVYFYVRKRAPWKPVVIGLAFLIPILFLKISIRQVEAATNKLKNQSLASTAERLSTYGSVARELTTGLDGQLLQAGVDATANRFDLTHTFAFVIRDTPNEVPYLEGESYEPLFWKLVPRVIYPGKPIENWGNEFGHRYGWLAADDDDTTVNMPQMVELYVNFGPIGVLLGMLLMGVVFGGMRVLLFKDGTTAQALFCIFFFSQYFNVESNFSLVFGSLPYALPFYLFSARWALSRAPDLDASESETVSTVS